MVTFIKNETLCFTGHRPQKLKGFNVEDNLELLKVLKQQIISFIDEYGVTTFISGMALGIDMWAARIVLSLKKQYPHIKLVAAVPCSKQYARWQNSSIREWHGIVERADKVVYVSDEPYTRWCMQKRNEWMVDHSQYVISVWDGTNGGTKNCIDYSCKKSVQVWNINPNTLKLSYVS